MSTPYAHIAMFSKGVHEMLEGFRAKGKIGNNVDLNELTLEIVKECVAYYNYPDASQAIRRPDGKIIGRRVTHFEKAKEPGKEPNWHELFTTEFIKTVTETDTVPWSCFHDTNDQDGDIMGQYTDFDAWKQAKEEYMHRAKSTGNDKELLLAFMVGAHLEVADFYNDQLFRKYVCMLPDGSIRIGRATFGPEEKVEAFGLFKSLLQSLQENEACKKLKSIFESPSELNRATVDSYRENYSPWLGGNSLRFVKPIDYDAAFVPSEEQLKLLEKAGLSYKDLVADTARFVQDASTQTGVYIRDGLDYIQSFHRAIKL